jgi:hypothetical protein
VNEQEYWSALEFRVSGEFAGMPKKHRGALWCDGFAPGAYLVSDEQPRIEGEAWIGYDNTTIWKITLFLNAPLRSRDDIDWDSLLPAAGMTRWLAIDERRQVLQIEPSAAVPDER